MEAQARQRTWPEPPGGRLVADIPDLGGYLDQLLYGAGFQPFGRGLDAASMAGPAREVVAIRIVVGSMAGFGGRRVDQRSSGR